MKKIILTQGKIALVDDEDCEYLSQWKWYAHNPWKNNFYAVRGGKVDEYINGKRPLIRMHCIIMGKSPINYEVDHENGNGLDNQRHNLRFVTHRQNGQNLYCKQTSRFPGIYWHKASKQWMARIQINGTDKYLGRFMDKHEAFEIYCQAVNELGEIVINN